MGAYSFRRFIGWGSPSYIFVMMVSVLLFAMNTNVYAENISVTFAGKLSNSNQIDTFGVFGPVGGNLNGKNFSATLSYNTSELMLQSPICSEYPNDYCVTTSGAITISVTINNIKSVISNVYVNNVSNWGYDSRIEITDSSPNYTMWAASCIDIVSSWQLPCAKGGWELSYASTNKISIDNPQSASGGIRLSYFTGSESGSETLIGVPIKLNIVNPSANEKFGLTAENYISTPVIRFVARSGDKTDSIGWQVQSNYTTSGGVGPFNGTPYKFSSSEGSSHDQAISSQGGSLTASVTQGSNTASQKFLVTGPVGIPNASITQLLTSLYKGQTAGLLCHIAVQESGYRQFRTISLYGVSAKWPIENFPTKDVKAGQYIGLLQVAVSMSNVFDWTADGNAGLAIFEGKVSSANSYQNSQIALHKGLPAMSGTELEDSALALFGGFGGRDPKTCKPISGPMRYDVPNGSSGWVVNPAAIKCTSTQGNTAEDYVTGIRNNKIPK